MTGRFKILSAVLFPGLLMIASQTLIGQEFNKNLELKLYTNFSYTSFESVNLFNSDIPYTLRSEGKDMKIGYLSPAISISKPNGNLHEFELSRLTFNQRDDELVQIADTTGSPVQTISGGRINDIIIGLRYEYSFRLLKKHENAKFRPFAGISINPYFSRNTYLPRLSLSYPTKETSIGMLLALVPRIVYTINDAWFIDLNIPISLADLSLRSTNVENPVLTATDRTSRTFEMAEFPLNIHVRLGIGFRL